MLLLVLYFLISAHDFKASSHSVDFMERNTCFFIFVVSLSYVKLLLFLHWYLKFNFCDHLKLLRGTVKCFSDLLILVSTLMHLYLQFLSGS